MSLKFGEIELKRIPQINSVGISEIVISNDFKLDDGIK